MVVCPRCGCSDSFPLARQRGLGIKKDIMKVTVDLDVVDVVLGVLCFTTNAVLLSHFKKHKPDRPGLRILCFFGMLFGCFLAFGKFFYHLGLGR
jgi:CDP-diglyceride synthetase